MEVLYPELVVTGLVNVDISALAVAKRVTLILSMGEMVSGKHLDSIEIRILPTIIDGSQQEPKACNKS